GGEGRDGVTRKEDLDGGRLHAEPRRLALQKRRLRGLRNSRRRHRQHEQHAHESFRSPERLALQRRDTERLALQWRDTERLALQRRGTERLALQWRGTGKITLQRCDTKGTASDRPRIRTLATTNTAYP